MIDILKACQDPKLFGPWFQGDSWNAWRSFLAALFGLQMDESQLEIYRASTNRELPPSIQTNEAWVIAGRRGGKSLIASLVAVYLSCFREYGGYLKPGEKATVVVIASDRRQARVVMRYIEGFLTSIPLLNAMVVETLKESIELNNNVIIEVHTCSFRAVRGYTVAAAICDEVAYWRSDESVNPDSEIVAALKPAMATIPSSLLLCISSPYARRGALHTAYVKHFAQEGDPTLIWQATTWEMNPALNISIVEQAFGDDAAAASAEYGATFRSDVESFISKEAVIACVGDYIERNHCLKNSNYRAFVDPAGGSGSDSYTLAIAHDEGEQTIVDCLREVKPKFNPEMITAEYCNLLKDYRINRVMGDKYAGSWPSEQYEKRGIRYMPSDKSKSELYVDALPLLNAGRVTLPNNQRLINQLCGLERKTGRGTGKDVVDHGPSGHDDCANVTAGVMAGIRKLRLAGCLLR